jgi:hypothetical protein
MWAGLKFILDRLLPSRRALIERRLMAAVRSIDEAKAALDHDVRERR